jgi:ribosomal subunit interface protein
MKLPLEVTFRNLARSEAIEAAVIKHAERLDRYHPRIMSCRVAVEARHRHHHRGNLYHVRVDVTAPNAEFVASREPGAHRAHEDVYVAVRDAFDAMRRQLEDHARRRRGDVKRHQPPAHGRVVELLPQQGYGAIETPDGRLVPFHHRSVLGAEFGRLEVGREVRFAEAHGAEGPRASTVRPVGKHHIIA